MNNPKYSAISLSLGDIVDVFVGLFIKANVDYIAFLLSAFIACLLLKGGGFNIPHVLLEELVLI